MQTYLTFSDAAKFADIARNIINGIGYGSNFNFWGSTIFDLLKNKIFPYPWTPPVMPYSIALFYKMFGVTDFAVIATSFFYFIISLLFVFLLARKLFKSNLVGLLSTLVVGFNYELIDYATKGASESPFIFEIVAASYFVTLKKRWANIIALLVLVLMYFTRSQAFIYISGIILYSLLLNFKTKKAFIYFLLAMVFGLVLDFFVLRKYSGSLFLYSTTDRLLTSSFTQGSNASDALRGAMSSGNGGIIQTLKNIFYNMYNFYKLLPQIINPYLFALFVIGLFKRENKEFKIASLFMVLVTLLVTAASIPFFRYIHPVIPLVYIIAVGTLFEIFNSQFLIFNQLSIFNFKITKQMSIILASLFIILFFGVGQTIGVLLLDSRFEKQIHNVEKAPVYVVLSQILKENTNPDDVVVTNLDTWGSWYGERKTVWFPLEPKQLIDPSTDNIPFNAIYLTSYKTDDSNYYMGDSWREIYTNPNDPNKWFCEGCSQIARDFKLKQIYTISSNGNNEKLEAKAILLIKK